MLYFVNISKLFSDHVLSCLQYICTNDLLLIFVVINSMTAALPLTYVLMLRYAMFTYSNFNYNKHCEFTSYKTRATGLKGTKTIKVIMKEFKVNDD